MGEVVDMTGQPAQLEDNLELIADCCRYSEKILSEESVRKKWHFDEPTWTKLGEDANFIEKIEAEKVRRIRTGQQKREKSQVLITKAPDILDSIASDSNASPRHRVDAIRTLDNFCANGPEAAPAADHYQITIVIGDDTLRFDKSIAPNAHDIDPYNDVDTDVTSTPWGMVAAISTEDDDGNGNAI